MLMRLNLDKVTHPIHCYYPASGQTYFERLRFGTIYHQNIEVIEHPIRNEGVVEDDGRFVSKLVFSSMASRISGGGSQRSRRANLTKKSFWPAASKALSSVPLNRKAQLLIDGRRVYLDDVSQIRSGGVLAVAIDTLPCQAAIDLAKGAKCLHL